MMVFLMQKLNLQEPNDFKVLFLLSTIEAILESSRL